MFLNSGPFWHLCTPGELQEIIFKTTDDFGYGVVSSALALSEMRASGSSLKLYAFAIMSNHIHELLAGSREDCLEYFRKRRAKLIRYFAKTADLSKFICQLIEVKDLKSFRNEVAYVHRNGFVNNTSETPFSYEWSTGRYYFNPAAKEMAVTKVSNLSYRAKKNLLRSKGTNEYDNLSVVKGYVSPMSFCEIEEGEALFRNAHQYFHHISRASESYGLIAKNLGDKVFLNDEEMLSVVYKKTKEMFSEDSPKLLPAEAKLEMARLMHNEYNASNGQIQRILKIDKSIVNNLFPIPR